MDTIKAIQSRRSIHKFKNKKPDWRDILEAIDSARFAPMAGGFFSLRFILIDEKEKIEKIARWSEQAFIQDAKYVVAFVSDPKKTKTYHERGERYMREQAGAAIENFLLHLTEVGLATCWIGHFNDEKIKQVLKIPEDQELEALFPIGYALEKIKTTRAKGNIDQCLFFNEWNNNRMKKIVSTE